MKYMLFAGEFYYAKGGVQDYIASSDDLTQLEDRALEGYEWFHIIEVSTMTIVSATTTQAHGSDEISDKLVDRVWLYDRSLNEYVLKQD